MHLGCHKRDVTKFTVYYSLACHLQRNADEVGKIDMSYLITSLDQTPILECYCMCYGVGSKNRNQIDMCL